MVRAGNDCEQLRDKNLLGQDLGRVQAGGMLKQFFGADGTL